MWPARLNAALGFLRVNTSQLENVAESLIAHELMRMGFFVAKPLGDELGADLIAFAEFKDGVRFCRIQCKGRTVRDKRTQVAVPQKYVTPAFVLFLYADLGVGTGHLFCFFSSDIRQWKIAKNGDYTVSITRKLVDGPLQFYRVNDEKMKFLRNLVESATQTGLFHEAVYCVGHGEISFG